MITLGNYLELASYGELMKRRGYYSGVIVVLLLILILFPSSIKAADLQHEIKLATLAPENSSLMKIFREMDSELRKETEGRVGFKFFSGFALGDERDIFRKLRFGLIHGATFTSNFLADINPDIRTLQVPFLFNNYQEVDYVLEKMVGEFNQSFSKQGYQVLGWSEIGFIHFMSTIPIAKVEDLKGKKVWSRSNAPLANAVFNKAQASPVTIGAPDVLVALQTNLVEVVYNSPYYALVTQWYTKVKYINDLPLAYLGGALLVSNKTFSRLSSRDQEITRKVCLKFTRRLTDRTRKDNDEALKIILSRGVKSVPLAPGELEYFKEILDLAVFEVDPKSLPADTLQKVRATLKEYRAG
jgi:TRAP-type C4-dicarboxylate transport system substrate-binding protein